MVLSPATHAQEKSPTAVPAWYFPAQRTYVTARDHTEVPTSVTNVLHR